MKKTRIITLLLVAVMAVTALVACGKCTHVYEGGVCTECGEADPDYKAPCTHTYENGACSKCGEACEHIYEDGACEICGEACAHSYDDGECLKCGETCTHAVYEDGVCTECGEGEPEPMKPEDGGASMYESMISDFEDLILYKYTYQELPPRGDGEPFYTDALYKVAAQYDPSMDMGYALKDINGDGYVELVLMGRDARLYAMFTIVEDAPVLVHVFQQGMGYTTPDGTVFYNEKDGSTSTVKYHIKKLVDGELVGTEYGRLDVDGNFDTDDETYYSIVDGIERELSHDEYKQYGDFYAGYWDYPTRLTRLTGYRFYSALPAKIEEKPTADFSTYESVIDTFGLMYSEVALKLGTKYEKSKWTSGAYDTGMNFTSDEDYYIYNRLIGACVLVQSSSSASFGYALRDLNGDSVDELILLESKYYVLAIFTEVDGKAVLLDSYTEFRSAWIDAEGLIHVKQRVPGYNKKDSLYYVYEVENGALKEKLVIGCAYESSKANAAVSSLYKLIDGEAVELEESEWDELYAEYALDLGDAAFYEYTRDNAALTFVPAISEE